MFIKSAFTLCLFALSFASFAANNPQVRMLTNKGNIEIELNQALAPKTVANFLQYVKNGHYEGTIFHRVIKGFMIQGGGFDEALQQKAVNSPIKNEAFNGLKNDRGTIAMARTGDPHSATAQFFINTKNNTSLNYTQKSSRGWGYAVFGKVTRGLDIVDAIENTKTGPKRFFRGDVPVSDIIIEKIEIIGE